jgi:hypothetical protein
MAVKKTYYSPSRQRKDLKQIRFSQLLKFNYQSLTSIDKNCLIKIF